MATRVRPVETEQAAPTPRRRTSQSRKTPARPRARKVVPLPARERFINRHVSWLDFNTRVLALGERPDWPLLERAKFLAIFSSNLDEFFQVRVAELDEQSELGVIATSPEGLSPAEQL